VISPWQAIVLGALQGLTEYLPISSSAHLLIVPWLLGWEPFHNQMAFDVALHLGTLLAVLIYFFFDWLLIIASYIGDLRQRRWLGGARGSLLPKIVVATIPGAAVGKLFEDPIEKFFYTHHYNLWLIAGTMSLFGLALFISERVGKQKREITELTYRDALLIGCAQALAIIPGVSRSGITILVALLLSLKRPAAARFSFLLATPITFGAVILKAKDLTPADLNLSLGLGILSAAIVGMLAIRFLLTYVQNRRYDLFVYYRWVVAAVIIAVWFLRGPVPEQRAVPAAPTPAPQTVAPFPTFNVLAQK
jgi:undecaprenyl-diphosphatase